MSSQTGISENVLGALLTSTLTSLPELVTMITAIRRGALTLAVGNIIGGNTFDVLFLSASDAAYRDGSLFHTMTGEHLLIVVAAICMTAILTLGLLRREKIGPASIGLESVELTTSVLGSVVAFRPLPELTNPLPVLTRSPKSACPA